MKVQVKISSKSKSESGESESAESESESGESVKISIRFLTNEIRADALDVKVFSRKCNSASSCVVKEINDELAPELTKQILKNG